MLYVGMYVHHKRSNACILDQHGQTVKTLAAAGPVDRLIQALRDFALAQDQPLAACFEASLGYGPSYEKLRVSASRWWWRTRGNCG